MIEVANRIHSVCVECERLCKGDRDLTRAHAHHGGRRGRAARGGPPRGLNAPSPEEASPVDLVLRTRQILEQQPFLPFTESVPCGDEERFACNDDDEVGCEQWQDYDA